MHKEQMKISNYSDKKKAVKLLRSIGFQMPIELQHNTDGYVGSTSYTKRSVKIDGMNLSDVFSEDVSKSVNKKPVTRIAVRTQNESNNRNDVTDNNSILQESQKVNMKSNKKQKTGNRCK